MTSYTILRHPTLGLQAVKMGFSWPGFFFPVWWTLVKRLAKRSLALFSVIVMSVVVMVGLFVGSDHGVAGLFGQASIFVVFGFLTVGGISPPGSDHGLVFIIGNIVLLIIGGYTGINSNQWRLLNLMMQGFESFGTVQANSPKSAIALFMQKKDTPRLNNFDEPDEENDTSPILTQQATCKECGGTDFNFDGFEYLCKSCSSKR